MCLDLSRRQVLKGSAAAMAVGAMGSLGALYSRQALAADRPDPAGADSQPLRRTCSGRRPQHRLAAAAVAGGFSYSPSAGAATA